METPVPHRPQDPFMRTMSIPPIGIQRAKHDAGLSKLEAIPRQDLILRSSQPSQRIDAMRSGRTEDRAHLKHQSPPTGSQYPA